MTTKRWPGAVLISTVLFILALSQLGATAQPEASKGPAGAQADLLRKLSWVPNDTKLVSWFPPDAVPILRYLEESALKGKLPSCWREQVSRIDAFYMLARHWGDTTNNVFHGDLQRESAELCLVQVLQLLNMQPTIKQDGAITEVSLNGEPRAYLGWDKQGYVFWHGDRSYVTKLLRRGSRLSKKSELASMIREVEPGKPWTAAVIDFSSALVGVPSTGFLMVMEPKRGGPAQFDNKLTVFFDTPKRANKAKRALDAAASDKNLRDPIRAAIRASKPSVSGRKVSLEVEPFIADEQVMQAIMVTIELQQQQARQKQGPRHP